MILTHPQIRVGQDIYFLAKSGKYAGNYLSWGDGEMYKSFMGDYKKEDWVQVDKLPDNVITNTQGNPLKVGVINTYWGDLINGLLGRLKK